jgi:prepilin-type processing-associated H-X9-DG protein
LKRLATTYIFVEEADTRGTNIGSWQMDPGPSGRWVDPVAMWHNRRSTLGFADGHAEMRAWQDQSFIEWNLQAMDRLPSFDFNMTPPADDREDFHYMSQNFPAKSIP